MSPRLDLALFAATKRESAGLHGHRFSALAFKVAVGGPLPITVAYAVDEDGVEHWLAVRGARRGVESAYVELLNDLLVRGLKLAPLPLVDAGGYPEFAERLNRALGLVVQTGPAFSRGGDGGGALAW